MELEAGRKRSGYEDIFISYHAKDDVQSTYAGAVFHNNRNYRLSSVKNNVRLSDGWHLLLTCYLVAINYRKLIGFFVFEGHTCLLVFVALLTSKKSACQKDTNLAAFTLFWEVPEQRGRP